MTMLLQLKMLLISPLSDHTLANPSEALVTTLSPVDYKYKLFTDQQIKMIN